MTKNDLKSLNEIKIKLQKMAGNRLMQIANPAREILNILNPVIEKMEKTNLPTPPEGV